MTSTCVICGREAYRSIAIADVKEAFGPELKSPLPAKGRVGLCKEHYRDYKRRLRQSGGRELKLARMKGLFR
ncbi:MAG: hypothetical protein DRJ69_01145 [Thermoprotei archaeon]|nr:MAG: hypothetical protein DRJ69_01145 [Thermoprotei archaeon]